MKRLLDVLRSRWDERVVRACAIGLPILCAMAFWAGAFWLGRWCAPSYHVQAQSITPITDWTSTAPVELGGSTTGSFRAGVDRIVVKARTASGTATLWLAQWDPATSKWWPYGPSCDLDAGSNDGRNLCRWVAQRDTMYWHVMRSSGSTSEVWIESINEPAGGFFK